ncbi:hypothetical protein [Prolixibacter denitrificans]|uniref:Uncharacterized protein n=1 Tax=Prolixibacter denitrificans TaxID=1541063 RepID=A0A2P8CCT9_9BACT|nr:hypothetical protein [Prolixibacter denitrificans]PSK82787.1 hypothetical protein CLV93_105179 [Prolixibacter denitrificans]GET21397.1 hypothetical protein JCM18694_16430 [Prolixibacter denitrificans]
MKTVSDIDFRLKEEDFEFDYQQKLTKKLDNLSSEFDQKVINEIVLWKVSRYSELSEVTFSLLNQIDGVFDEELTKRVLKSMIGHKGIQLPMASTILRFKNPKLYQIIDQRVYRILYGEELKISPYKSRNNISSQVELYLTYLSDLRILSKKLNIPFEKADRILYNADKRLNKGKNIKNY